MFPTLGSATLLDRDSERRQDAEHVSRLLAAPEARFLVLAGGKAAICSNADRSVVGIRWFARAELEPHRVEPSEALLLGTDAGAGRFAIAIGDADSPQAEALQPLVDLRSLAGAGAMRAEELSLLGEAKALAEWHAGHRYCGACGAPTGIRDGGWRRVCQGCGREHYPRVDPVVIMLVVDGDRCLLAREARFPPGMMSALAGFVEPGEDVVHAVAREVREEAGVEVGAVAYALSQPWPFPHSLMIGCFADARTTALAINARELEEARWFDREEVAAMLDGTHPQGLTLPGPYAIAHALVRRWLDGAA